MPAERPCAAAESAAGRASDDNSLTAYGVVAAFQPSHEFGRVLAAYGGVFIIASLLWGVAFDGFRPDRADIIGALICLVGVAIIMYARRREASHATSSGERWPTSALLRSASTGDPRTTRRQIRTTPTTGVPIPSSQKASWVSI